MSFADAHFRSLGRPLKTPPHLAASGVDPDGLYVLWAGANDLLAASDPEAAVVDAVSHLADCLVALASGGAQHIVVPNMPNPKRTPLVIAQGAEAAAGAELLSAAFNAGLHDVIQNIEGAFGIDVIEPDTFTLLDTIVTQHFRFGIFVTQIPALSETLEVATHPDRFAFWDAVHPTRVVHEIAGDDWTVLAAASLARSHLDSLVAAGSLGASAASTIRSRLNTAFARVAEVRPHLAAERVEAAAVRAVLLVLLGALDWSDAVPYIQAAAVAHRAVWTSVID